MKFVIAFMFLFAITLCLLIQLPLSYGLEWPPLDVPPPILDEFTALVDMSKIRNATINSQNYVDNSECPDVDLYCYWPCSNCVRPGDVINCPDKGVWGLTFDDGPTEYTPKLLDYLDAKNITVTFFIVGSRVVENPDILKRIHASGHQIGVHTWSHPYLTTQSTEQVIAELQYTAMIINDTVGVIPKYMRPPYGDFDDRIRDICTQLGYDVTVWDLDTNDWMSGDPDYKNSFQISWVDGNFSQWVKTPSTTGHISLEHDLYKQSAAQGPSAASIVINAGYKIQPVGTCRHDVFYQNSSNTTSTTTTLTTTTSIMPSSVTSSGLVPTTNINSASPSPSSAQSNPSSNPSSASIAYNSWSIILSGIFILLVFSFNSLD